MSCFLKNHCRTAKAPHKDPFGVSEIISLNRKNPGNSFISFQQTPPPSCFKRSFCLLAEGCFAMIPSHTPIHLSMLHWSSAEVTACKPTRMDGLGEGGNGYLFRTGRLSGLHRVAFGIAPIALDTPFLPPPWSTML